MKSKKNFKRTDLEKKDNDTQRGRAAKKDKGSKRRLSIYDDFEDEPLEDDFDYKDMDDEDEEEDD